MPHEDDMLGAILNDPDAQDALRLIVRLVIRRKAEAAIVNQYRPEDFQVRLHRRAEREDERLDRLEAIYKQRDAHEAKPERKVAQKMTRTIDPAAAARIAAECCAKVELQRAAGIEPEPPRKSKGMRR
jgi:hypothetical protein